MPATPAASSACFATFAISQTAQRKTVWPSWRSVGHSDVAVAELDRAWRSCRRRPPSSRRSPRRLPRCRGRRSGRRRRRPRRRRAGTRSCGRSGSTTVGELLGADHERVVRGAGADERVGLGDAVGEPGAGRVDVVGRGGVRADAVGEHARRATGSAATLLMVATITRSIWSGAMPDFSIASRAASSARSTAMHALADARRARR